MYANVFGWYSKCIHILFIFNANVVMYRAKENISNAIRKHFDCGMYSSRKTRLKYIRFALTLYLFVYAMYSIALAWYSFMTELS